MALHCHCSTSPEGFPVFCAQALTLIATAAKGTRSLQLRPHCFNLAFERRDSLQQLARIGVRCCVCASGYTIRNRSFVRGGVRDVCRQCPCACCFGRFVNRRARRHGAFCRLGLFAIDDFLMMSRHRVVMHSAERWNGRTIAMK